MPRRSKGLRDQLAKVGQNKLIRARVIEVLGGTVSVQLSQNAKKIYGIRLIGGPVSVGDVVHIDYISSRPVAQAIGTSVPTTAPETSITGDSNITTETQRHTHTIGDVTDIDFLGLGEDSGIGMQNPMIAHGDMIYGGPGASLGTNWADMGEYNVNATARTEFSPTYTPAGYALQNTYGLGDPEYDGWWNVRWNSYCKQGYPTVGEWFRVDLGTQRPIKHWRMKQKEDSSYPGVILMSYYDIHYSDNDVDWYLIVNHHAEMFDEVNEFSSEQNHRYFRFTVTATDCTWDHVSPGIWRLDLLSAESTDSAPTRLPIGDADQILTVDSSGSAPDWREFSTYGVGDLGDADPSSPNDGEALVWNTDKWVNEVVVVDELDDIGDVNTPSPIDGDSLLWVEATSKWTSGSVGAGDDGIGLKYRFVLYDESAEEVFVFNPTYAGLTSALSASDTGDIIIYPNVTVSGDITIPDGVYLIGQSRDLSILDGQITIGDDSGLENMSLITSGSTAGILIGVASVASKTFYIRNCSIKVTQNGPGEAYAISCDHDLSYIHVWDSLLYGKAASSGDGYAVYKDPVTSATCYIFGGRAVGESTPFLAV